MCIHFWRIDSMGLGKCKLCGDIKQHRTYIEASESQQYLRQGVTLENLGSSNGGYPVQGIVRKQIPRSIDYCFSVDMID